MISIVIQSEKCGMRTMSMPVSRPGPAVNCVLTINVNTLATMIASTHSYLLCISDWVLIKTYVLLSSFLESG